MGMYVVEHSHTAESCPAGDAQMGPMLLAHVAPPNAEQFGVQIIGDAVVDGGHTYVVIANADNEEKISQWMTPFAQAGSVSIRASSTCADVVARGSC